MPLGEGEWFDPAKHPKSSWPRTDPTPLVAPGLGQGQYHRARVAQDGTRWCAYGNHTLAPASRKHRCDSCAAFRDRLRHRPEGTSFVALPTELVDGLLASARACDVLVERLHAQFLLHVDITTDDLTALFVAANQTNNIAGLMAEYIDGA